MDVTFRTADGDHFAVRPHSPGLHSVSVSNELGAHMILVSDRELRDLVDQLGAASEATL